MLNFEFCFQGFYDDQINTFSSTAGECVISIQWTPQHENGVIDLDIEGHFDPEF